jgi:hypothetical protein
LGAEAALRESSGMSQNDPYRIFVSHVWAKDDDYLRLFEYLESTNNFFYRNYSRPDQAPSGDKEAMRAELRRQIEPVETVIILSSLYKPHQDWIEFQMNAAQALKKPLIVMEPFGDDDIPEAVRSRADEIGHWSARSIEDAIRRTSRHEDTQRWDVIEWDPEGLS